jgi:uncharacterized membrane protein YjfL (UPF0719 family)
VDGLQTLQPSSQLSNGNVAVGLMIMGMFIGIGTALGLVVGLGLN